MDPQHLIDVLIGVVLVLMGAVMKALWDAVKSLQKDLNHLEVQLPSYYVPKEDHHRAMEEIKALFNKIADKLDNKMDKGK